MHSIIRSSFCQLHSSQVTTFLQNCAMPSFKTMFCLLLQPKGGARHLVNNCWMTFLVPAATASDPVLQVRYPINDLETSKSSPKQHDTRTDNREPCASWVTHTLWAFMSFFRSRSLSTSATHQLIFCSLLAPVLAPRKLHPLSLWEMVSRNSTIDGASFNAAAFFGIPRTTDTLG